MATSESAPLLFDGSCTWIPVHENTHDEGARCPSQFLRSRHACFPSPSKVVLSSLIGKASHSLILWERHGQRLIPNREVLGGTYFFLGQSGELLGCQQILHKKTRGQLWFHFQSFLWTQLSLLPHLQALPNGSEATTSLLCHFAQSHPFTWSTLLMPGERALPMA